MIAYTKNADNSINILGGSDKENTLKNLFKGQDFLITDKEPVIAGGKYYLDEASADYQEAKEIEAKEKLKADLEAEYTQAIVDYQRDLNLATLRGDADMIEELKAEFADLQEAYAEQRKELE